jgi:hypothetical protein
MQHVGKNDGTSKPFSVDFEQALFDIQDDIALGKPQMFQDG